MRRHHANLPRSTLFWGQASFNPATLPHLNTDNMQPAFSLGALNFALAGAREGFGPFLGVYLQKQGFDPAATGFAMG
ncbi:hypothetical protein MKK75_17295, partial [Methylobacterium sp. J-030]|nr:hypothetical protein [Methylobacterium sp. J-030]